MTLTILYYLKNNIYIFIVQSFSDDVFIAVIMEACMNFVCSNIKIPMESWFTHGYSAWLY